MSAMLDGIRRHACRAAPVAVRAGSEVVTYRQLLARASALAGRLDASRIRTLALLAPNSPDWIVVDIAALLAGVTLVPIPEFFSPRQRRHVVESSGADAVIMAPEDQLGGIELSALEPVAGGLRLFRLTPQINPSDATAAKISYTSGTTGEPKGVRLPLAALEAVAISLREATQALEIRRHLCLLPLSTLLENIAGVYAPFLEGAEVIVPNAAETGVIGAARLDVDSLVRCIRRHEPHSVILVPQMLAALVAACEAGACVPRSLRFAAVGGAHVPSALLERAERCGLPVYEGYGLTECASVVAMNVPDARRTGSVGRALPHARVRVHETGEIIVAGAAMSGYVGEPGREPTEIHTGDVGRIDADGFIYVHGRRRNVFITSFGRNVSPEWVEAELARSKCIRQAALFGEARPWNVAVIVAASTRCDEIAADIERVNENLPDYARVGQWILADEPFSPENGLATMNGRLRRDAILRTYRQRIDLCYEDLIADSPRSKA